MNIQDPYMHGADPGNIGSFKFDYVISSYESKVCDELIASTWVSKETEDTRNAVDPNSMNSRNAGAAKEIYSPLGPDAMRLLKLHGGKGKIQCSVMVVQECSPPEYEALSYVWGSTDDLQIIKLDGLDYFVTRNLFEVLLRFRKLDKDRLLWIDALVINQSDLVERGREVTRMPNRYSGAVGTILWLGAPLENAQYGRLDIIAAIKFLSQPDLIVPIEHETGEWVPTKQAVEAIFCSRYWTRAWTVQEIMYSDNVTLYYGSCRCPWIRF
ncbi:heterokaryon incompatibility protein [Rutstroemia sp. NJR-2017a BVV2]|nr:heterokaryon incompatibility protein [Rutstroemia sp. NJR-2017a BVV2]